MEVDAVHESNTSHDSPANSQQGEAANGIVGARGEGIPGMDDETDGFEQEGMCIQEMVSCLLDAKGASHSTSSVQSAINASVIQVAKANFPMVINSIFSFLEKRQTYSDHQLGLLRLLCQVLEICRSDSNDSPNSFMINRTLARSLSHHLIREVAKLGPDDERQHAISDVLTVLAPIHPDVVLSGLLTMLDNCGNTSVAPPALISILTEVAHTTPHVFNGRIHEVMARYLPLLQSCKLPDVKMLFFRAWCALCIAMVNCAMRQPGDPAIGADADILADFSFEALRLRNQRPIVAGASVASKSATERGRAGLSEETEESRKATQSLATAFSVFLSSWQGSKDLSIQAGTMETLGHLCLVIPKDQFLTNADTLLDHLVSLLSHQTTSTTALPPKPLMRGLFLFFRSAIDADPEASLLQSTLPTFISILFAWVVASGPLQCIQGIVTADVLQGQAEVLRCFNVLAQNFPSDALDFILQKLRGENDSKLGALFLLRHLIGSSSWRPSPAMTISGIQQLTNSGNLGVCLLLIELIGTLSVANYFTATHGEDSKDKPRHEHVHSLLRYLLRQTALAQTVEVDQSYVANLLPHAKLVPGELQKLVAKSDLTDAPTCHEVRGCAGIVLEQVASHSKPEVRLLLWPMLLHAIVNPEMRAGLSVLCRAATHIAISIKATHENPDIALSLQSGSPQPELLLMWLLMTAHHPHEAPGLGLSVLHCLESLSSMIHRNLGNLWEAPSTRLQVLRAYLEKVTSVDNFDADFWFQALSQEVHVFLSGVMESNDLASRLIDTLRSLHNDIWRKGQDATGLSDLHCAGIFNLTGVCLSHIETESKVKNTLEFVLSHCSDLIIATTAQRACARGLGVVAQRHFELVIGIMGKASKTEAATRKDSSLTQSIFGKSVAVQHAEHLRAMLALALGYTAAHTPTRDLLVGHVQEHILTPLHLALTQERALLVLANTVESVKLACDAIRSSPENTPTAAREDLLRDDQGCEPLELEQEPDMSLVAIRDDLMRALLPFVEIPDEQDDEQRFVHFEGLMTMVLDAMSSLIALPLDLPSDLYASALESGLQVLIYSIPNDASPLQNGNTVDLLLQETDPSLLERIHAIKRLVKSLLFHAHSWLSVSRLLQAVYAAGANCPVEFIRWTCTHLLGVLCADAPALTILEDLEDIHSDVPDWCESLALLLPRTGDSCTAVAEVAVAAVQQVLSRCEWTADVRIGTLRTGNEHRVFDEAMETTVATTVSTPAQARRLAREEKSQCGEDEDAMPPSQQLVGALVSRLPPTAIPLLVQHLLPAMHDADERAAMSGVDALYLILQACSEKLSAERATSLISTVFEEVEKVSHACIRHRVLSCIKVLTLHHFESAVSELLDTGPEFSESILGALQVLAKESGLLLRLLSHFTDRLNNSDPGTHKRPNRLVLAATVALGHLCTINDSPVGVVVKKHFPRLFGTFLLRIGTTTEGLHAQQTAASFVSFLQASQNDAMAMALEGNRLARLSSEYFDEVICELTALFCRHHPTKRKKLLYFIHPFVTRPFPGHRIATVTVLSQLLASGNDHGLENDMMGLVVQTLVKRVEDAHSNVRKQAIRGLGHLVFLWQQDVAKELQVDTEISVAQVLPALCAALHDSNSQVQKEAVVGIQRACQVDTVPYRWRQLLLGSVIDLQPLVDNSDVALRGASLDLLGKLCLLAGSGDGEEQQGPDHQRFGKHLDHLLINCIIRLEDASSAVSSAAGRCLHNLAASLTLPEAAATQVVALLQHREAEQTSFEDFVFRLIALVHRPDDEELVAQRLELCRRYFEIGADVCENVGGEPLKGVSLPIVASKVVPLHSAFGLSTCIAAGFVAAAFARCCNEATRKTRPTALLCGLCRDLMSFMIVEDSGFRTQIARILGFFDILTLQEGFADRSQIREWALEK